MVSLIQGFFKADDNDINAGSIGGLRLPRCGPVRCG
jgi:hypothetical protein